MINMIKCCCLKNLGKGCMEIFTILEIVSCYLKEEKCFSYLKY